MPRVQAYGQRQVNTRPLADTTRRVPNSPDQFGGQLGDTLARVGGNLLAGEFEQARQKADQVALLAAQNQLDAWQNTRLYDPEKGAFTVKGKDALALPDTLSQEYNDIAGKIEAGLSGERQKAAFQRARSQRWQGIDLSIKRHVFSEQQSYDQQETKSFVELATANAVANANDPRRIGEEMNRAVAAVRDHAKRNGIGPDQTAQQVQSVQTAIHTGVIDRLLSSDQDQAAKVYFEETKGQISGDALARIEKAVEEGTLRGTAQKQTDTIMAGSKSMTQALEMARGIDDPQLRDAVQQRVEHEWSVRKQVEREGAENLMITAANAIDSGGLRAVSPTLWTQLEPGQRMTLENYAKRNQVGGDPEGKTDLRTYYSLMQTASSDPTKFSQENLLNYLGKLGKTEFKQLTELQNSIRKGDRPGAEKDIEAFTSNTQVFSDILDEFKIKPDDPRALQLRRELDKRVEQAQLSSGGKKLTHTEIREMADRLVGSVVLERGGWTNILPGGKSFYDRTKAVADLSIDDIPTSERPAIASALRAAGKPVTEATILDYYIRAKRKAGDIR